MITLGQSHTLRVIKNIGTEYTLDALNLGPVGLDKRWVKKSLSLGEQVRVFIYRDQEAGLISTTQRPFIEAGQFGYLRVTQLTTYGAFMYWGMSKDLLIPFSEQHLKLEEGRSYMVHAYINQADQRIIGSTKVDKFIDLEKPHQFKPGQAVKLTIGQSTPLGYKAVINKTHWGLLKKEEVFQRISFGQNVPGFIQTVRPDGKINLTLNGGYQALDKDGELILDYLRTHQGFAPFHDKSNPKQIYATFGISKAAFKKAIGGLYKQNKLTIEKDGIKLTQPCT